jgi:hypothetical protein
MATSTPPQRTRDLGESQQKVRHPLERIRGTIRTYVGLEGVALLITLLAMWFWITFVLDFFPFRALDWDWVQDFPYRWARALSLGWLFLCGVIILRSRLIAQMYGDEPRTILRTAFATSARRQSLPVWLRLPLVAVGVAGTCWAADAIGSALNFDVAGTRLLAAVFAPLVGLAITGSHELFGVTSGISRWVRAPVAAAGAAIGALVGVLLGYEPALGGSISAVILSGLLAVVGDVLAVVSVAIVSGLARGEGFLVALTVPCVAAYLMGWLVAGLAAAVSPWLAAALVLLLMIGPVIFVVAGRLTRDFSAPSLALVLERRFPEVLGDRLITAVELADPKKAARYGYSEVMIEHTIHDAAERVVTVPVSDVFDWKRLARYWIGVVVATVGMYLVMGGLFCIPLIGETGAGERAGFGAFHQAAGLALERNLLLQNTIWPRRAFLEILDWPDDRDKHVGKDDAGLSIKIRAYKWVVADPRSSVGWRALTWNDLVDRKNLLGEAAPAVNFRENDEQGKRDWGQPRNGESWTLDEIETRLNREEAHENLEVDTKEKLRDALKKLEQRAGDPSMRRSLRMLIVPTQVFVRYRGARGGGELTLQRQGDNEYTQQFPDLKETVTFTARGEDYETPRYRITVVPPPSLVGMTAEEERAAYTVYRARGDDPGAIRGLKQRMPARPISTTGGDTSRVEAVYSGSNLVLTGESDKELKEVVIDEPRKGAAAVKGDVRLLPDRRHFEVRFDDVRTTYDFYFRFVDTENVKGERHVIVKPQDDLPPEVNIDLKIINGRKTGQGYMITAAAYIPLEATVTDDRGLHLVEYACTVTKLDRQAEQSGRGLLLLGATQLLPGGPGQELVAAARIASLSRESKAGPKGSNETAVQKFPALTFKVNADEYRDLDKIKAGLGDPKTARAELTKLFKIENIEEKDIRNKDTDPPYFFDLAQVKNAEGKALKVEDRNDIQPRYRMQLWLEATDTDVEGGKEVLTTAKGIEYRGNRGRSKETLTFVVVPENELLSEIAKEEDGLYIKLGEQIKRLKDGLDKLDDLKRDLTVQGLKAQQFAGMQARADELGQTLDKAELSCNEVATDYQRILRELVTNRVDPAMIEKVQKQIVEPLNVAVNGTENDKNTFPSNKSAIESLKKAVAGQEEPSEQKIADSRKATDEARLRMDALIKRLIDVLDKMEALGDVNKLIKALQAITDEENRQKGILKAIHDQILKDALGGP